MTANVGVDPDALASSSGEGLTADVRFDFDAMGLFSGRRSE